MKIPYQKQTFGTDVAGQDGLYPDLSVQRLYDPVQPLGSSLAASVETGVKVMHESI